jgi:predicted enzyme related to lactoylglutathione lyase
MPRVVHFEISANEPEQVVNFYKNVFNWQIDKWEGPSAVEYWMVTTGDPASPGINGGIFKPKELFTGTVNTIEVPNLEAYLEKVKSNGGTVVLEKFAVPTVGYMAYCKDVEGSIFGLMQLDDQAGK